MKVKTTFLLFFFPFLLMAQEKTNTEQKNKQEWKFAAGITVFDNIQYSSYQKKQPLTLNLRYALTNRHILRMSIPIARNEKILGDGNGAIFPTYPSPEALAKDILNSEVNTTSYDLVRENRYNLYGASLGYDYNYPLIDKLSAYAGLEMGFYRLKTIPYFIMCIILLIEKILITLIWAVHPLEQPTLEQIFSR